jgi:demethylmenaquinone methyltransferase / 2-methoxy-6-polyprenyl-1,4-benzoquinol methylase
MTGATPGTLPEPEVQAMFDRIARVYDRLNSVMTAGLHHSWRRRAAQLAGLAPGDRALDVATGTGDLALELGHRVAPDGAVIAVDFSEQMLKLAREKLVARGLRTSSPVDVAISFQHANAMALPFEDAEFDAATVGFGARNFADLPLGLAEMVRVVKPGGRVVVLELTTPTEPPLSTFFDLWFDRIIPVLGRVAGDSAAYSYLPSSVRRFPGPEALAAVMSEVGLDSITYRLTAGGIIAIHVGEVRT